MSLNLTDTLLDTVGGARALFDGSLEALLDLADFVCSLLADFKPGYGLSEGGRSLLGPYEVRAGARYCLGGVE